MDMKKCDRCGKKFEPTADQPLVEMVLDHYEEEHGLGKTASAVSN
jgi:hypothetical protein